MATKWQMETKSAKAGEGKQCVTPYGRVIFAELIEPKSYKNGEPKFSVVVAFDDQVDLAPMKAVADRVRREKHGSNIPRNQQTPFRRPDESTDSHLSASAVWMRFGAWPDSRPAMLAPDKSEIVDPAEIYPGCYVRCVVKARAYDTGYTFDLQVIQKLAEGEPIKSSGNAGAENMLDAVSSDGIARLRGSYDDEADGADLFD